MKTSGSLQKLDCLLTFHPKVIFFLTFSHSFLLLSMKVKYVRDFYLYSIGKGIFMEYHGHS